MYEPPAFRSDDTEQKLEVIRQYPLGLLISHDGAQLVANPVPFEFDGTGSEQGVLRCHLSRANQQWKSLDGQAVLAVFQGVNSYVTPQWYAAKREHGKVVPTWNYAMVQVRGTARVLQDAEWLRAQVTRLTDHHEALQPQGAPWKVSDAPEDYLRAQLKGIVGVEIAITAMNGKFKASQNRSQADQDGVAAGLAARGEGDDDKMAALVRRQGRR